MSDRLHISASDANDQAKLPKRLLEQLGIADGGDMACVVSKGCLVLKPGAADDRELDRLADEIMDEYDEAFRALS